MLLLINTVNYFKKDNNGLVIIACAIITSLIGAILFPVEDKEEKIEAIAAEKEEK